MVVEQHLDTYFTLFLTINVTLTLVVMLAACLCCRKKIPKNELLGLEGMVKLTNPDEVIVVTTTCAGSSESQADLNLSTVSNADSEKRASTAAHRSLPDIPVADANGDNGSELYETVVDKRLLDPQRRCKSPSPSLKKQISVSQHSSISQADDVSSPYSRVKNTPHDYAKVRSSAEHPYAQLNAPSTSSAATGATASVAGASNSSQSTLNNESIARSSHHSGGGGGSGSTEHQHEVPTQAEIPAASAIAGMISASQDLPYMTPPIASQHFSGDSQDSSKGYTSISVREPLANILAQQPSKQTTQRGAARDVNDSHYATVSDDSDETYAAIEDPNGRNLINGTAIGTADIYTSGSETYAQIQPMPSANPILVAVEINTATNSQASSNSLQAAHHGDTSGAPSISPSGSHAAMSTSAQVGATHNRASGEHTAPVPPPVDSLRAQMHSRQPSSASNNSTSNAMSQLGSPKPEKRQANSPLPPTPKSNSLASGRSSNASVSDCASGAGIAAESTSATAATMGAGGDAGSPPKKKDKHNLSPSKDIEGMYAKVMKKNKFSRHSPPSQSNSPVMTRKSATSNSSVIAAGLGISPLDSAAAVLLDAHKINISGGGNGVAGDKTRTRSNSYGAKDHGYETIPADMKRGIDSNRRSDCYTNILQQERQQESGAHSASTTTTPPIDSGSLKLQLQFPGDKHYETIPGAQATNATHATNTNDPGYETLLKRKEPTGVVGADKRGAAASHEDHLKKSSDYDPNYEVLKGPRSAGLSDDGYAKVVEKKRLTIDDDGEGDSVDGYSKVRGEEECEDGTLGGYSTIGEAKADANHNYASIVEAKIASSNTVESADTEPDHYARIAESNAVLPPTFPLSTTVSTPAKLAELSHIASPTSSSSLYSASLLNNTSSTSMTTTTTRSSSSTMSSRQTPTSSSQYESLTGSDTDPNYESVNYAQASREPPYERLPDDSSDTQLSSSSATTPNERSASIPVTGGKQAPAANGGPKSQTTTTGAVVVDVVVDDYFQV